MGTSAVTLSPLAGKPPSDDMLIDVDQVLREYHERKLDLEDPRQRIAFGTSGHRGSPLDGTFNEAHLLAMTQAVCDHRKGEGITGPLFLGKDTHAVDGPAHDTALEVLAANGVQVIIAEGNEYTPVPVLSHAILTHNRGRKTGLSDGIAITPSHNPPRDGGFKYNPPSGGPAPVEATSAIEKRANALLLAGCVGVMRLPLAAARLHAVAQNLIRPYVDDLAFVVDMDVIRHSDLRMGVDPLGGASVHVWQAIRERYRLNLDVINPDVDFTFRFVPVDHDGQIRMDCSSQYAMAGVVALKDRYQIAFGNDTDSDRYGIVVPSVGLVPPNHAMAAMGRYLFARRADWRGRPTVGKTVVTTSLVDRVAAEARRTVFEVPVGFKWFVPGLLDGTLGFVGEESAGATLLCKNGKTWTTDKDGLVINLLACEIGAITGKDLGQHYEDLEAQLGRSYYRREDQPATPAQKTALGRLDAKAIKTRSIAGEPIVAALTRAPGNDAPIGGLKVVTENGWFAARPSGTEAMYKLYAESLVSSDHLGRLMEEARALVADALA